jgi:hypothetical protein
LPWFDPNNKKVNNGENLKARWKSHEVPEKDGINKKVRSFAKGGEAQE